MERYISFLFLLLVLVSCNQQDRSSGENSIRISAASSLTTVMKEIKREYEKKYTDQTITIQYASSGTLAHQLLQGAPSDLYISASVRWMDKVVQEGLIERKDVQPFVTNRLVLSSDQKEGITVENLTNESLEQFAMGDPESVPAGAYTKQALQEMGIWEKVQSKAVYGKSVRQVASYIQSQNVEVGFVYQSDVQALKGVKENQVIPEDYHEPITYPLGTVKSSINESLVKKFIQFLNSPEAEEILQSYGFVPIK